MKSGPKLVPAKRAKQPTELQKLLEEARFLREHWKDLERRINALVTKTAA
jgi:hypothetical protein